MEEHDCFLLAETSVNDNMACCRGNFRACGGKFSQRCSPAVLYPCELISSGKSPSLAHFHLASWMELRVWSPEPICQLMWHPSHQTWALCLLHSGIACQIIFIPLPPSFHPFHPHPTPFYTPPPPQKNAWICATDSESPALALSGSFWLDAKPIILISLFCSLEWPQTMQISSRTY